MWSASLGTMQGQGSREVSDPYILVARCYPQTATVVSRAVGGLRVQAAAMKTLCVLAKGC